MTPDTLLEELRRLPHVLRTSYLGRPLHVLRLVPSTSDIARTLAGEGAGEGTTVIALEQSAGRGRRGRSWVSPPGGLYLSVLLHPRLPAALWPSLSLAAAVGAAEGIEAAGGPRVRLKWPNDVLVEGRKAGGILVESGPGFAIVGVGINAGAAPDEAASVGVPLAPLARAVLEHLEEAVETLYADPPALLDLWRGRSMTLGKPVRVVLGAEGEALEGIAEDVDAHGALLVRTPAGVRRVLAGDVSLR